MKKYTVLFRVFLSQAKILNTAVWKYVHSKRNRILSVQSVKSHQKDLHIVHLLRLRPH